MIVFVCMFVVPCCCLLCVVCSVFVACVAVRSSFCVFGCLLLVDIVYVLFVVCCLTLGVRRSLLVVR